MDKLKEAKKKKQTKRGKCNALPFACCNTTSSGSSSSSIDTELANKRDVSAIDIDERTIAVVFYCARCVRCFFLFEFYCFASSVLRKRARAHIHWAEVIDL